MGLSEDLERVALQERELQFVRLTHGRYGTWVPNSGKWPKTAVWRW